MSFVVPGQNPSGSPKQDASNSYPVQLAWGTAVQLRKNPAVAAGTVVSSGSRVVSHESPEYRFLSLQLQGPDEASVVPLGRVKVSVGVSGAAFERIVQVGVVGVSLGIPASRVYVDMVEYNNTDKCSIVAKVSHGIVVPTGFVETYTIPALASLLVPIPPFAQAVQIQQWIAGASIDAELVTPWLTTTIAGIASGFLPVVQNTRGLELSETLGVAAQVTLSWQLGGS